MMDDILKLPTQQKGKRRKKISKEEERRSRAFFYHTTQRLHVVGTQLHVPADEQPDQSSINKQHSCQRTQ